MKIKEQFISLIYIVFGWLIIFPLSLLIPRKKNLIISTGRTGSDFTDNTKYFHLYLIENHTKNRAFFISDTKNIDEKIPNLVKHPSLKSIWLLLRADFVVVDYSMWFERFKYHLSIKAKKIQLWHGIGSKKIEMDTDIFQKSKIKKLKILYGKLRGQLIKYQLFTSTSEYYTKHMYKTAFFYKYIEEFGLARSDVLFRKLTKNDIIGADRDIIKIIEQRKAKGRKIVLYTPTYRARISNPFLNNDDLDTFGKQNNIIFVIKHHMMTFLKDNQKYENVLVYDKNKDIYPLMSLSDLMITDYSSIYMDFMILNKPIIFFVSDYEKYQEVEAKLRSDFFEITPGEKVKTQKELHNSVIETLFNKKDNYKQQRKDIVDFSYKHKDGRSCERIYKYIIKQ